MSRPLPHEEVLKLLCAIKVEHPDEAQNLSKPKDARAEDVLFREFFPPLKVYLTKRLGDQHAANELLQKLFLEILLSARAGKIELRGAFGSFLHGAVRNKISQHWRQEDRRQKLHFSMDVDEPTLLAMVERMIKEYVTGLEGEEQARELDPETLMKILARLPARDQDMLQDYYGKNGLTGEKIKQKYGFTTDEAARQHLSRLRRKCYEQAREQRKKLVTLLFFAILLYGAVRMMESA